METERQEDHEMKKDARNAGGKHVVWLDPNDPEGAYAAMMALLDESNAKHDIQQQEEDTRTQ